MEQAHPPDRAAVAQPGQESHSQAVADQGERHELVGHLELDVAHHAPGGERPVEHRPAAPAHRELDERLVLEVLQRHRSGLGERVPARADEAPSHGAELLEAYAADVIHGCHHGQIERPGGNVGEMGC
jgi:hypothetical protein